MERSNFLLFDDPTNHLDLETITALNNSLINFKGNIFLTTQDFQFANSVGNRVIEIGSNGYIDKLMNFGEYLNDDKVKELYLGISKKGRKNFRDVLKEESLKKKSN